MTSDLRLDLQDAISNLSNNQSHLRTLNILFLQVGPSQTKNHSNLAGPLGKEKSCLHTKIHSNLAGALGKEKSWYISSSH